MTSEAKACLTTGQKLKQTGWLVQDRNTINPNTDSADYLMFMDRQAVGVIVGAAHSDDSTRKKQQNALPETCQ